MAMQVAGYFNNGLQGTRPTTPSYPAPMAPVYPTNYNATGGGADSFIQSAVSVAPLAGGLAPGRTATNGVHEAKMYFKKAKGTASSTRGMNAKTLAASNGRSAMFSSVTGAIKSSLIFNGLFSLALNGYKLYKNQETTADAGANFAGDMTSAVVGGAAAGVASAAGTFLLSGLLGTGLVMGLAGMAIGAVAYFVADNMLKQTSFYNSIKLKVHQMLGA